MFVPTGVFVRARPGGAGVVGRRPVTIRRPVAAAVTDAVTVRVPVPRGVGRAGGVVPVAGGGVGTPGVGNLGRGRDLGVVGRAGAGVPGRVGGGVLPMAGTPVADPAQGVLEAPPQFRVVADVGEGEAGPPRLPGDRRLIGAAVEQGLQLADPMLGDDVVVDDRPNSFGDLLHRVEEVTRDRALGGNGRSHRRSGQDETGEGRCHPASQAPAGGGGRDGGRGRDRGLRQGKADGGEMASRRRFVDLDGVGAEPLQALIRLAAHRSVSSRSCRSVTEEDAASGADSTAGSRARSLRSARAVAA